MTYEQEQVVETQATDGLAAGRRTSLKDRMKVREEELRQRTTEVFPVPRWESVLAVELRAIAWTQTEQILERHMNRPSQMMLSTAADELIAATVGFYEIKENDQLERVDEASWQAITAGVVELPEAPPQTAERVAMIALCTDQGVMALNGSYRRWLGGANIGIGSELRRDFETTP